LLSNVASDGALELVFQNYPTEGVIQSGFNSGLSQENCIFRQLGWAGAWEFYVNVLRSGHLCFQIPPNHPLTKLIDYETIWNQLSLNNLGRIWRMDSFTNDNSNHIRQTTDFRIIISQELLTPEWQQ
jgi:hypothetical protein